MDHPFDAATQPAPVVFVLDCDNTLLDNDGVKADMDARLHELLGAALTTRFWQVYEDVRKREGVVDLPLTFDAFGPELNNPGLLEQVRSAIMDYPFANKLFPDTTQTLAYLHTLGVPVIVSDGDTVYQPRKIERSGLAAGVNGQWVVYAHKEHHLDEIMRRWPAEFYVMVDDKARILADTKRALPNVFVTAHILQGHYAGETHTPAPDVTFAHIGEIQALDLAAWRRYLG